MHSSLARGLGLPWAARRRLNVSTRLQKGIALAMLVAASAWAILILASGTGSSTDWISVGYRIYAIAAPALVGLLWWRRRPGSRIGTLLVVLAAVAAVECWQASAFSVPFSIGVVAEATSAVLIVMLCLSFPTGRVKGRPERALMAGLLVVLSVTFVPWFLSGAEIWGNNPAFDCRPDCPPNAFQLTTLSDSVREALAQVGYLSTALIGLATFALYLARMRHVHRPRRRALAAVVFSSMLVFPVAAAYVLGVIFLGPAEVERSGFTLALAAALVVFPIGFAVPLIQSDLVAGSELQDLLKALAERPSRASWRDRVAAALDDPLLRLGYWDEVQGRFIEPGGQDLLQSTTGPGRMWVEIDRGDGPVAALVTDPNLAVEPELVDAVAVATIAAVTTGQLEGTHRELSARAAGAAEAERQRLAREIQAGPQQRLAALRVGVATLGERNSGRQDRSFIEEFGRGLDSAIIELANATRTRAAGYVTRNGLVSALRSVRRDSPIDVRINGDVRRHPPRSELCVYYCCLEAIQNAIKHAGPGASVSVRLFETGEGIGFEVADDGVGFDPGAVAEGSGLHNIRERVASVGGTVEVSSVPGRGTRITGTIPDRMNE